MFLDVLRRRNPAFLEAVFALHQAGELPAGAFAIDLDAVEGNARAIATEAARLGLDVLAMTKQVGRNPRLIAACRAGGIEACVAVDTACARAIGAAGGRLGHVGHLVQVPTAETAAIAALEPDLWTLYSLDRAREAAAAARDAGREQAVMARLTMPDGVFYLTQEGGFEAADVERVADALDALEGLRFAGLTTFPASLYDREARVVRPTPNLRALVAAAERLRAAGRSVRVNGPGTTSTATLAMLRDAGVDQVEPGHGLTGTTPAHALDDLPELPAVAYVSEVSHHVAVPGSMLSGRGNHYALEVKGDSMIDAGINDGDIVVIREQNTAENGDIVVALVEEAEATLKRFRRKGSMIALEAANPAYETRVFPDHLVKVQGRLVGLIRSY